MVECGMVYMQHPVADLVGDGGVVQLRRVLEERKPTLVTDLCGGC
jgi:hypothetical protein